jgi:hypothetical protein
MDNHIYFYIKWAVIIEMTLVILLVLLSYTIKLYTLLTQGHHYSTTRKTYLLTKSILLKNYHPKKFEIRFLKKNIRWVLSYLNYNKNSQREAGMKKILELILKPIANKYKDSHFWYERYITTQCLKYDLYLIEPLWIKKLILDDILIVSLNITESILDINDSHYVDIIIDHYSQGRHMQQSLFSAAFNRHITNDIMQTIYNRLSYEKNDYVRIFCYRALTKISFCAKLPEFIYQDLNSNNKDLVIAGLKFLSRCNRKYSLPIIRSHLKNPIWQIRAASAKLIGRLNDALAAPTLAVLLKDNEWWVRINSAVALSQLGEEGLAFLKAQTYDDDKYAYDVAQNVLTTYLHNKGLSNDHRH